MWIKSADVTCLFADFEHHAILQNTLSLEAKLPERELRKAAQPLATIIYKNCFTINLLLNKNLWQN